LTTNETKDVDCGAMLSVYHGQRCIQACHSGCSIHWSQVLMERNGDSIHITNVGAQENVMHTNDNYANSFTASTDVSTRKCFVQIQLRVINFHPWFQCFVPKRVHAILQDTHIGNVNAVFRRSMEWGSWVAGLNTSLPMMQSSCFAHHPLAKSYTFRTVSCSSLEECVELFEIHCM